jgi:hypothetical protein
MRELAWTLLLLGLLLGSSYIGLFSQRWMREHHRSRDTTDSVRLVITILVTFAALVLGLLVTSAKSRFDAHTDAVRHLSTQLIELDLGLREYGPQAEPIRALIRQYTAAAIAATWPNEPAPKGHYPSHLTEITPESIETDQLTTLLMRAGTMAEHLVPANSFQTHLASFIRAAMQATLQARWAVIESAEPTISWPFLLLLMFWLVVIFAVFGLTSPRNGVIHAVIVLSALSLASSLYLILDLDTPFGGFISVSSQPIRDALLHMDQPAQQFPPE